MTKTKHKKTMPFNQAIWIFTGFWSVSAGTTMGLINNAPQEMAQLYTMAAICVVIFLLARKKTRSQRREVKKKND